MPGQAANVVIRERQQELLLKTSRDTTVEFRLRQRARITLLAFSKQLHAEVELNPEAADLYSQATTHTVSVGGMPGLHSERIADTIPMQPRQPDSIRRPSTWKEN